MQITDLGSFFQTCLNWVLYPWTNWTLNAGSISIPFYWFLIGCALLAVCIWFIEWLAGTAGRLRMFNIFFGASGKFKDFIGR